MSWQGAGSSLHFMASHKEFDFEQIRYIEKQIEQECLVRMGVMI